MSKENCPGCDHEIEMLDYGHGCEQGDCDECGGRLECVLVDDQEMRFETSFLYGSGKFQVQVKKLEMVWSRGWLTVEAKTATEAMAKADPAQAIDWEVYDGQTEELFVEEATPIDE